VYNKITKLDNLKSEQRAIFKKTKIFEVHLKKSKNIDDKITLIKLKQRNNNFVFFERIKTLMKKS